MKLTQFSVISLPWMTIYFERCCSVAFGFVEKNPGSALEMGVPKVYYRKVCTSIPNRGCNVSSNALQVQWSKISLHYHTIWSKATAICNRSTVELATDEMQLNSIHKRSLQHIPRQSMVGGKPAQLDIGWNVFEDHIIHSKAEYSRRQAGPTGSPLLPPPRPPSLICSYYQYSALLPILYSAINTIAP